MIRVNASTGAADLLHQQPTADGMYPQYRQQGLPLTSSHMESTSSSNSIKQRIKGTEKFWQLDSGEGGPATTRRHVERHTAIGRILGAVGKPEQNGSNRYQTAV